MLVGPVFYFDLVRLTRRGRYALIRCLYGAALGALLFLVYLQWIDNSDNGKISVTELAEFGASFFLTFLGVQFVAAVLLTPAYAAGAIAEEKERRTLEFLLATDLRDREIVLSKLGSRV